MYNNFIDYLNYQRGINIVRKETYDSMISKILTRIKLLSHVKQTNMIYKMPLLIIGRPLISEPDNCTKYIVDKLNQLNIRTYAIKQMVISVDWGHLTMVPLYEPIENRDSSMNMLKNDFALIEIEKLNNKIKILEINQDNKIYIQKKFMKEPKIQNKSKKIKQDKEKLKDLKHKKKCKDIFSLI